MRDYQIFFPIEGASPPSSPPLIRRVFYEMGSMHMLKKKTHTTTSLLLKDLSVVSYFALLKSHHFCRICTAVGCVLLIALQNGQYFTGRVIRKKETIRGFSVFSL